MTLERIQVIVRLLEMTEGKKCGYFQPYYKWVSGVDILVLRVNTVDNTANSC